MQSFLRAESLLLPGALGFPSLVAFLTTSLHMGKLRARERGSLPGSHSQSMVMRKQNSGLGFFLPTLMPLSFLVSPPLLEYNLLSQQGPSHLLSFFIPYTEAENRPGGAQEGCVQRLWPRITWWWPQHHICPRGGAKCLFYFLMENYQFSLLVNVK